MQVIQITSLTGHSPYDITICDITKTYCYSGATGVTTAPLTIDIPTELLGTTELLVVVTDSIGCEEIQYHFCGEPKPSPSQTPTPTPTPTNLTCNCISIENPSGITLNFGYIQCSGLPFYGEIYSATTLYVCGRLPYGDSGLIIATSSNICTGNVCPGPTPTPTTTPTPTPTLPPIVGYFEDTCDSSNQFTLSDIPISFSPLSGVYYIESSGFIGCATSVISSSTTNIYSFIAMGSQPSIYHCQKANFLYPCPTLTPTPSVTPTITPTSTLTPTPTLTQTPTNTPTPSMDYRLYQVVSCCNKSIVRFMNLPTYFLPGMVVVSNDGNCWSILSTSTITPNEFWNHSTTYIDCKLCINTQTCSPPIPLPFISVWVTTIPSQSIMLPYETTGSYNGTIDWGDGTTSTNSYANRAHTYTTPGTYTITITGTLIGWSFLVNSISKDNIYEVLQWGCLRLGNSGGYFYECNYLSLTNVTDILDLSGTYDLSSMFNNCYSITTINNINSWNTSNVTNMSAMFFNASFNQSISDWDVSNVTNMLSMFNGCSFNQPLSGWNVSNVTNMEGMFSSSDFNLPINDWDVSNVVDMGYMFSTSQFNQPLSGWNVGNVTNMNGMFAGTFFDQNINTWDVSSVTGMSSMFLLAGQFDQNLNSWDTSSVTDMSYMFLLAYSFNGDVSSWDVSSVTNMTNMFSSAGVFNQNIGGWDVSNVTNMSSMFNGTTFFNQPLSGWNVSNVTNMSSMFRLASSFNQNIGNWNVTGVTNFNLFMFGKTFSNYSTTNLDAIYNGWSSLPSLQSGININFGSIKYTAGSSAGRAILTATYLWTITDGGI